MKYVDSNVFIFALKDDSARNVVEQIAEGLIEGATSCLTWDEFLWVLRRSLNHDELVQAGKRLITLPHVRFMDVNLEVIESANELVEKYSLHPRDAIHAASALLSGAHEIISEDTDFDRIPALQRLSISSLKKN